MKFPTPTHRRRIGRASVLTAATCLLAAAAAPAASAAPLPSVCGYGGNLPGSSWTAYTENGNGSAKFVENGDNLTVYDRASDGKRTVAHLYTCYDSAGNAGWDYYDTFDSGSNDGAVDSRFHNLDFRDGGYILIRVCTAGSNANCGEFIKGQA